MERGTKLRAAKGTIIFLVIPFIIYAYEYGADAGVAGVPGEAGTCNQNGCHTGGSINGIGGGVSVTFPHGLVYSPGVTQQLTVTITNPTKRRWGFELTARRQNSLQTMAGSFAPTDNRTQLICDTLADLGIWLKEQNQNKACPGSLPLEYIDQTLAGYNFNQPNPGSYTFNWNPPATDVGPVTIYVAGLAGQGNLTTSIGDNTYTATYTLTSTLSSPCNYSLSSSSNLSVPAGGGAQPAVNVAASSGCTWTAVSNVPWTRVTFGQSGSGNGSFGYSVDPNNGPARTGTITAAGLTFTVMQAGCTFTFVPGTAGVPYTGGNDLTFQVQTGVCTWNATTTTPWITIVSGSGGPGSGTVTYSVAANPAGIARSGSITVGAQQFAVTQAAAPCVLTVPTGVTVPAAGVTQSFNVNDTPACTWTASSSFPWITVNSAAPGTGNGTVAYTIAPNAGPERKGAIRVNDQNFVVTQSEAPCSYSATASQTNFSDAGGSGTVMLQTAAGCAWTTTTNAPWIIIQGASGSGPAIIGFTVSANSGAQRNATLSVGGQAITISQAAFVPPTVVLAEVRNAATSLQGPVSPGEIITITGTSLGPDTLVLFDTSTSPVASTLAGTRVLFDGVAAPMVYSWISQVSAVVPFGVSSAGTRVQVEYQGALSKSLTLDVVPSTPAIFGLDGTGTGQANARNQDDTVNSADNPAAPGSMVRIFATGGGLTNPGVGDGAIISNPAPPLLLPATIWIGGEPAQLQSAGSSVGLMAGVVEIDAYVPLDLPPGPAAVLIQIGDAQSQAGITIVIGSAQ